MTSPPELTSKLSDVDAHTPCIFPAHLAQGTAMNAEHSYLQFTGSFLILLLPFEPWCYSLRFVYLKAIWQPYRLTSLPPKRCLYSSAPFRKSNLPLPLSTLSLIHKTLAINPTLKKLYSER